MTEGTPELDAKAALRRLVVSDEGLQKLLDKRVVERGQELRVLTIPGRKTYTPTIGGVAQPGEVETTRMPSATPPAAAATRMPATRMPAKGTDAEGGDLTWAGGGGNALPPGTILHERAINKQYKGEDVGAARFAPGLMRGKLASDDPRWTTAYDADATESVQATSMARPGGAATGAALLYDEEGAVLDGTFGYVVDPKTGTLHTFNRAEAWVLLADGQRLDISTFDNDQRAAVISEALKENRKVSTVHHSTALAGGAVAGAGTIKVVAGRITKIDDESGHYRAEAEYLWQTVNWLAAKGMAVAAIDVKLIAKGENPELILKGWKLQLSRGDEGSIRAREAATPELGRPERQRVATREDDRRQAAEAAAERARTAKRAALEREIARLTARHIAEQRCEQLSVQTNQARVQCASCYVMLDEEYRELLGT